MADDARRSEIQNDLSWQHIEIVADTQAALAVLQRPEIPRFILLDLPLDSALELCTALKKHEHFSILPIFVLEQEISADIREVYGIEDILHYPLTQEKFEYLKRQWAHIPKQFEEIRIEQIEPLAGEEIHSLTDNDFRKFKRYLQAHLYLTQEKINQIQDYRNHQLYDMGLMLNLTSIKLAEYVAQFFALAIIFDLQDYHYEADLVPEQFSRKNHVLPLRSQHNVPYLAIANPFLLEVVDFAERYFKHYTPVICCPELVEETLNPEFKNSDHYRSWNAIREWRMKQSQQRALPPASKPRRSFYARKTTPLTEPHFAKSTIKAVPASPVAAEFVAGKVPVSRPESRQDESLFGSEATEVVTIEASTSISVSEVEDDALEPMAPLKSGELKELSNVEEAQNLEARLIRAHEAYKQKKYAHEKGSIQGPLQSPLPEGMDPDTAPIIHLVNSLIAKAHLAGASDIHIEPQENEVLVRFRIDGELHIIHRFEPCEMIRPIVARIKIMSDLDMTERRLPQDGSIHFAQFNPKHDIELRVATAPMKYGEKVVMRILDRHKSILPLNEVGFSQGIYDLYQQKIKAPYGMILHVGPTGSGKSTTLYAALNHIAKTTLNIQTIEDPVEYTLPGINQLEVNADIGLSFARALRSYLRQDPDVILVGEIRDEETAKIAVQASLTGHLLLSTLHTNDSTSTLIRLMEMGIPAYMIASSLLLVCGQRLLRRLCPGCKQARPASSEWIKIFQLPQDKEHTFFHPLGCPACNQTGYRGRLAIYEVLTFNEHLRKLIQQPNLSVQVLRSEAIQAGLVTLFRDAVDKALLGLTSPDEVIKTVLPDSGVS